MSGSFREYCMATAEGADRQVRAGRRTQAWNADPVRNIRSQGLGSEIVAVSLSLDFLRLLQLCGIGAHVDHRHCRDGLQPRHQFEKEARYGFRFLEHSVGTTLIEPEGTAVSNATGVETLVALS